MNDTKKRESLETRIGLYLLHRLGIAALVFGVVFLLLYSFQYFGPALKIMVGVLVSAALVGSGEWLAAKQPTQWFGNGLSAGGWSLAYFTAYASYYVPAAQVNHFLPLETILLIGVALASLVSALRANSQLMAILSFVLAFGSILITGPSLSGDLSFLIIAASASVLGNRKSWYQLFGLAVVSCYIGHFYCTYNVTSDAERFMATLFLAAMWAIFAVGIGYLVTGNEKARLFATITSCLNAVVFGTGLVMTEPEKHVTEILLAVTGSAYLGIASWLKKKEQTQLATVHSLTGLMLINVGKSMRFAGLDLLALDVMQVALLAGIGIRYNIRSFRWFAGGLTFMFFPTWGLQHAHEMVVGIHPFDFFKMGLVASAVFASVDKLYRARAAQPPREIDYFCDYFYCTAANIAGVLAILSLQQVSWQLLGWFIGVAVNCIIALKRPGTLNFAYGLIALTLGASAATININIWETLPVSLSVVALYAVYAYAYCFKQQGPSDPADALRGPFSRSANAETLRWIFSISGHVLLTALVLNNAPADFASVGLGIEAFCLLVAGFLLHDRNIRIAALAVLALLTSKLLFVDAAKFDTLERIISFIGAGLVFLVSSFVYGKFNHAFEAPWAQTENPEQRDEPVPTSAVSTSQPETLF